MLFRGQNMLGYRPYADDAVEYFVQKSVANGIDVIRIFDALNDPRNLQTAIKAANKEGAHVQGCISYTLSPVHNNEYFANYAKTLEEMGADSICIKDMAGLLTPYTCYELVNELKKTVHPCGHPQPLHRRSGFHVHPEGHRGWCRHRRYRHEPSGSGHLPHAHREPGRRPAGHRLRHRSGSEPAECRPRLLRKSCARSTSPTARSARKSLGVDANTLLYQVPGGMFSNMLKQLKDAGKEDKLDEVLAEIPRVREDAGYPPLVTPTSQIVGTQAVFNVIMGERYKMVTKEFKGLVHGDYGKTPRSHQRRVQQVDPGRRAADHLPLCRHP